jgi:hypothetical protein
MFALFFVAAIYPVTPRVFCVVEFLKIMNWGTRAAAFIKHLHKRVSAKRVNEFIRPQVDGALFRRYRKLDEDWKTALHKRYASAQKPPVESKESLHQQAQQFRGRSDWNSAAVCYERMVLFCPDMTAFDEARTFANLIQMYNNADRLEEAFGVGKLALAVIELIENGGLHEWLDPALGRELAFVGDYVHGYMQTLREDLGRAGRQPDPAIAFEGELLADSVLLQPPDKFPLSDLFSGDNFSRLAADAKRASRTLEDSRLTRAGYKTEVDTAALSIRFSDLQGHRVFFYSRPRVWPSPGVESARTNVQWTGPRDMLERLPARSLVMERTHDLILEVLNRTGAIVVGQFGADAEVTIFLTNGQQPGSLYYTVDVSPNAPFGTEQFNGQLNPDLLLSNFVLAVLEHTRRSLASRK